jgi:hypothetical protein
MAQKTPKHEDAANEDEVQGTTLDQMVADAQKDTEVVRRSPQHPPSPDDLIKIQVIAGLAYLCQIDILTSSAMVEGLMFNPPQPG